MVFVSSPSVQVVRWAEGGVTGRVVAAQEMKRRRNHQWGASVASMSLPREQGFRNWAKVAFLWRIPGGLWVVCTLKLDPERLGRGLEGIRKLFCFSDQGTPTAVLCRKFHDIEIFFLSTGQLTFSFVCQPGCE